MKKLFNIPAFYKGIEKSFFIRGPIDLEVDYDDVDHREQERLAKKVVKILNEHWSSL